MVPQAQILPFIKVQIRSLRNDPKSVFYTVNKITKSFLKKKKATEMGPFIKDDVFVKLFE